LSLPRPTTSTLAAAALTGRRPYSSTLERLVVTRYLATHPAVACVVGLVMLAGTVYRATTLTPSAAPCIVACAAHLAASTSELVLLGAVAGQCGAEHTDDVTSFVTPDADDAPCCCIGDWAAYAMVPPGTERAACCALVCRAHERSGTCVVSRHNLTQRECACPAPPRALSRTTSPLADARRSLL
jgi:hypothetical protein